MLSIAGVALVVIVAIAASFSGIFDIPPTKVDTLLIQTDLSSYVQKRHNFN